MREASISENFQEKIEIPTFPFKRGSKLKLNEKGLNEIDFAIKHLAKDNYYFVEDYIYSVRNKCWLVMMRYVGEVISSSTYTLSIQELKENYILCED